MTVLERHSCEYTVDCIKQLFTECHILYTHMNNIRVCAIVSWEHPETLDFDPLATNGIACHNQPIEEAKSAREATLRIDAGLDIFQLVPRDENGSILVMHCLSTWFAFMVFVSPRQYYDYKDGYIRLLGSWHA